MKPSTSQTSLLFFYTESSLHVGSGSTVSTIDLPIQREQTTNYPMAQGSGIKGALRSQFADDGDMKKVVFGDDKKGGSEYASAASFSDARIILFPVRSLNGVFAYTVCPFVLARLAREAGFAGVMSATDQKLFSSVAIKKNCALVTEKSDIKLTRGNELKVVLEEYSFTAEQNPSVAAIAKWIEAHALPADPAYTYWRDKLQRSLIILSDDDFKDFVTNNTEVITRVAIDNSSKTVKPGALWVQESLPADTLLFSSVTTRATRSSELQKNATEVSQWLSNQVHQLGRVQIGGDETTGQGVVSLTWSQNSAEEGTNNGR